METKNTDAPTQGATLTDGAGAYDEFREAWARSHDRLPPLRDAFENGYAMGIAAAPTPVADSEVQRAEFHAWLKKEWPQLTVDFAPLNGFYKGDDGEQIGYMWDGWKARAAATPVSEDMVLYVDPLFLEIARQGRMKHIHSTAYQEPTGDAKAAVRAKPVSVDAGGMTFDEWACTYADAIPIEGRLDAWKAARASMPDVDSVEDLLARHVELNMSNYDDNDVSDLNDWAIEAFSMLETLAPAPPTESTGSTGEPTL